MAKTVLCVDDSASIRQMVGFTLKGAGYEVVEAVDGNILFTKCGLGLRDCDSERPCPLHQNFVVVRNALQQMMEQTAVATLAEDVGCGLAYLK